MPTLRQFLVQPKRSVPCRVGARTSKYSSWPELENQDDQTNSITLWDEFNLETLNASYGHILDAEVPDERIAVPDPNMALRNLNITKAFQINHLIRWSDGVLRPTLEYARTMMGVEDGVVLKHRCASADALFPKVEIVKQRTGASKADHAVELEDYRLPFLLLGLGKPNSQVDWRKLRQASPEATWTLRQLASLCFATETRYGYILTNEELLACCFSTQDPAAKENFTVAVMPVSWSKSGPQQLTTDLALWWLCMLSMSSRENRKLTTQASMTRIDEWQELRLPDGQSWVRRHKYSKFEEPINPPIAALSAAAPPAAAPVHQTTLSGTAIASSSAVMSAVGSVNVSGWDFDAGMGSPNQGLGNMYYIDDGAQDIFGDVNFDAAAAQYTDPGKHKDSN